MIRLPVRASVLLLAAALATGCRGHGSGDGWSGAETTPGSSAPDTLRCEAARPDPASLARVDGLAGTYRVVLVAESGPVAGETASGSLHLVATDSAAAPFRGWTDAPVTELGATVPGDPASRDPGAPGVRVLVGPPPPGAEEPPSVTIRLGSHANRPGPPLFDGAYAALHVRAIGPRSFAGTWASGVTGPDVEGRFCAERRSSDTER